MYLNSTRLFAHLVDAVLFGNASRTTLSLLYFNSLHCKQFRACVLTGSNDWLTVSEELDGMRKEEIFSTILRNFYRIFPV